MSAKAPIKMGACIICGEPAPVLEVKGKSLAICFRCVPIIDELIHPVAENIRSVSRKPEKVKKLSPEEFKEKLIEVVEKKGSASIQPLAKAYGVSLTKAKEIAQTLVQEKGYIITRDKKKFYLSKPTTPAQTQA